ncbi:hypothetical protein MTO96_032486 [Rhipicephalus appendiculatus]
MEGLSEESKQAWFPALGERIGNSFHNHGMEHFPLTCTATLPTARDNDRICPINDYLPICNELLFNIGIELREQRGGTLSLVCFQPDEPYVSPPPDADLHRSSIFLRWLLRTHVCITSLTLHYNRATAHGHAVLEELPENTHLQKLRAEFRLEATTRISLATLLPRLPISERAVLLRVSEHSSRRVNAAKNNDVPYFPVCSCMFREQPAA